MISFRSRRRSQLFLLLPASCPPRDLAGLSLLQGRMRLLAVIKEPASIARYLAVVGEASEVPRRSPGRGPPYWKSQVLRRQVLEDEQGCGSHDDGADEAA